jgi:hypothetical protein
LNKAALLFVLLALASFSFLSCGGGGSKQLTTRVLASQSVSSPTANPGLIVINGENDTQSTEISVGTSPGLMAISPQRTIVLAFDSATNNVQVVTTKRDAVNGGIQLPGPTTSMVVLASGDGYAAVPSAPLNGSPPGAVEVLNLTAGGVAATVSVPSAQTVVSNPDGTQLLVFSNDSDNITVVPPLLVNTGSNPITPIVVAGCAGCRPVYAVFSADGGTAYILNCGAECAPGGAHASVQTLDMAAFALGTPIPLDGATIGWLNGSTLYVAGNSTTNSACTGQTTAATTCGRLDLVDIGSMAVTGTAVITDGYHDRIDLTSNGQLFIGSHTCTNVGNVNSPTGEVRGCLSIFNTTNATVVIPPDNGDVTGLQSFASRYVEYVAEGGRLRVYDTTIDSLLLNSFITTGTITITGEVVDVKAIDFF